MMLPLAACGFRKFASNKILFWTQLIIFASVEQQTGAVKKSPTDLMCYQNYTLKDNFCYCSWKAGEESQNPTYTLNYSTDEGDGDSFDAGHQTYYTADSSEIHFKKPIYVWVEAREGTNVQMYTYKSENITVLLDKAVKLDPPDLKDLSVEKHGRSVTVNWTRINLFSQSMETKREIQYKVEEFVKVPCKIHDTGNKPNCYPSGKEGHKLPICKESCTFDLDGDKEHYIHIRQKYEESIWSEWSHPVYIPADIDYYLNASYKEVNSGKNEIRNLSLDWKPGKKNQGDINYNITLILLPCPEAKLHKRTKNNWLYTAISDASYNATVVAFNQAQKTPPWTLLIEDSKYVTGSKFNKVALSERQLKITWKKTTRHAEAYCIEWKSSAENGSFYSSVIRNDKSNHESISIDHFKLMQCYKIRIHTINSNQHSTVGTAYYFRPSMNIGPANLTVVNFTSQSVFLQWNEFDLQMCQNLLKKWEIVIKNHNTNTSRNETSSEPWYLVENLSLGISCTFEVRGVTIYGEYTGQSEKHVSIPSTAVHVDTGTNTKWIQFVVIPVCLLMGIVICVARTRLRMYLCPVLPDPSKSTVTTFVPNDSNYILCPKYLIDSSSENRQTDSLEIESNATIKDTNTTFIDSEIKQVVTTSGIFDNEIFVVSEAEADLQFAYKKQEVTVTPSTAKEVLSHEIRKLKDDFGTEADLKENVTLLSSCEDATCV